MQLGDTTRENIRENTWKITMEDTRENMKKKTRNNTAVFAYFLELAPFQGHPWLNHSHLDL